MRLSTYWLSLKGGYEKTECTIEFGFLRCNGDVSTFNSASQQARQHDATSYVLHLHLSIMDSTIIDYDLVINDLQWWIDTPFACDKVDKRQLGGSRFSCQSATQPATTLKWHAAIWRT